MGWFLYERDARHERINHKTTAPQTLLDLILTNNWLANDLQSTGFRILVLFLNDSAIFTTYGLISVFAFSHESKTRLRAINHSLT